MNSERLKMLEQFLLEDPNDPFNIYALALEYSSENPDKANELFTQLLDSHADYLPTYYAAGNHFAQLNKISDAMDIFQKGIALATRQNNQKTLRELRAALENLD